MKRILAMVFCIIVIFGIVACNNNNSESSVNLDSSLPNEEVPEATAPPVDENPYPNNVVAIEGVNRYEHLKMEAPAKTVSVTEYQDYGIEQIDIYLNAIAQDESIPYNTTYLCMELTKRKYAIYTQENFDKIDLILIDAENLLKKYILEDEEFLEIQAAVVFEITDYYGKYNDYYFFTMKYRSFVGGLRYEFGNCFFWFIRELVGDMDYFTSLFAWKRGDEDPKHIGNAHSEGIISDDELVELFQHELVRLCVYQTFSFNDYTWKVDSHITASNFYSFKAENSLFLIHTSAQETVKCAVKKEEDITFLVTLSYLDVFKSLPYGVKIVECGIVNHQDEILFNNTFNANNPTEIHGVFTSPSVIDYYRGGSIKSAEYFNAWKFKVKEYTLSKYDCGWIRFYINLEYTNGYKETYYGEKLYYSVNKNQYDAQDDKYYNVYTFSEKFTPQDRL